MSRRLVSANGILPVGTSPSPRTFAGIEKYTLCPSMIVGITFSSIHLTCLPLYSYIWLGWDWYNPQLQRWELISISQSVQESSYLSCPRYWFQDGQWPKLVLTEWNIGLLSNNSGERFVLLTLTDVVCICEAWGQLTHTEGLKESQRFDQTASVCI